jgi:hypothetical protein
MLDRAKTYRVLSLALLLAATLARAQDSQPIEYRFKAAFLWNFAKFIEWPPRAFTNESAPFIIGVLGTNPFGEELEQTVRGKQIGTHPIKVQLFRSADDAKHCHILFVSASEQSRLAEVFKTLGDAPALTVGEYDQFTQKGGMINFVREGNKIRFQINDAAAQAAGLKISSKLLSLAVRTPSR